MPSENSRSEYTQLGDALVFKLRPLSGEFPRIVNVLPGTIAVLRTGVIEDLREIREKFDICTQTKSLRVDLRVGARELYESELSSNRLVNAHWNDQPLILILDRVDLPRHLAEKLLGLAGVENPAMLWAHAPHAARGLVRLLNAVMTRSPVIYLENPFSDFSLALMECSAKLIIEELSMRDARLVVVGLERLPEAWRKSDRVREISLNMLATEDHLIASSIRKAAKLIDQLRIVHQGNTLSNEHLIVTRPQRISISAYREVSEQMLRENIVSPVLNGQLEARSDTRVSRQRRKGTLTRMNFSERLMLRAGRILLGAYQQASNSKLMHSASALMLKRGSLQQQRHYSMLKVLVFGLLLAGILLFPK